MHDTKTGEALWQREHDFPSWEEEGSLFISKHVAGYVFESITGHGDGLIIDIALFNTSNGDLIYRCKKGAWEGTLSALARGRFMCLTLGAKIDVLEVRGNDVKRHSFPVPMEEFKSSSKYSRQQKRTAYKDASLVGFIGKSQVLLGKLETFGGIGYPNLFTFDLQEALCGNQEKAFSVPINFRKNSPQDCSDCSYEPVYKSDKVNKSVEMVGVMRQWPRWAITDATKAKTVEVTYFVTEMKCPNDVKMV